MDENLVVDIRFDYEKIEPIVKKAIETIRDAYINNVIVETKGE